MFYLDGLVADVDGAAVFRENIAGKKESSERIGKKLAERLLSTGAREILEKLKADAEQK